MKVTCQRESLQTACQLVSAAVPAHSTIPALKNFKATALDVSPYEGGALELVGYDVTQGVGIRFALRGVKIDRMGSCILPKDQLVEILRESTAPEITLEVGTDAITARTDGKYQLPLLPVGDFPDFPSFDDDGRYHEVTAGALRTMIKRTAFAADRKDTTAKFQLQGVLWEAEGNEVRLAATDTKRLALSRAAATLYGAPEKSAPVRVVPLKAIGLLDRNLTDDGEIVRVALRTNDALFRTESATIYTSLLQGKFPPYRDIIAKTRKEVTQKVLLPREPFLARVRQAAIMADDESNRVEMVFEPGKVTMRATGAQTGSSEVVLELPDHDGPRTEIAFDQRYLTEMLKALEGEEALTLEMHDGLRATLFTAGAAHEFLIMPLIG
jgi:DNA polymerase III subunit beta